MVMMEALLLPSRTLWPSCAGFHAINSCLGVATGMYVDADDDVHFLPGQPSIP